MKLFAFLAVMATVALAGTTGSGEGASQHDYSPTDLSNPMYAKLNLSKGDKAISVEPVGDDTVLEEGAEHETESKATGMPEPVAGAKPEVRTLDKVNLPESDLEKVGQDEDDKQDNTARLAVENKEDDKPQNVVDAIGGVASRGYYYCPSKCNLYRRYCPRRCKARYCYRRYRVKYRVKYRVRVRKAVRVRRRVRVRVKYCKWYRHYRRCYYKYIYRWVYGYVYRYRYYYRYRYVYRYKYKRGLKCTRW